MPQNTSKTPASNLPDPGLLLAEELAAALRTNPRRLTQWEREGRIPPAIRIGRRRLWRRSDLELLLGTSKQEVGQ